MIEKLNSCQICPHECKVDRLKGKMGRCKSGENVKIALVSTHNYEEPCISGKQGSGTIFFSNCNLNCVYCQNYEISQMGKGKEITIKQLADIFIKQQEKNVQNINLVTPTMYVYQIKEAIELARKKGLKLPIIYNTNSYEKVETLKELEGYIDVYLPDLKYYSDEIAKKYSGINNYFEIATKAIKEMIRQVGNPKFDNNGTIQKGVILRHLVLPGHIQNSKNILKWIKENLPEGLYVSVMAQYFPTYKVKEKKEKYIEISRKLTIREYKEIEKYLYMLDLKNGYIQELGEHEEEYVPKWHI